MKQDVPNMQARRAPQEIVPGDATPKAPTAFESAVDHQLDVYRRLAKLVDRQRELITAEDPSALLTLLSQRRKLTDELEMLIRSCGPLGSQWESIREAIPQTDRDRVEGKLREVRSHLQAMMDADDRDVRLLKVRKSQAAGALRAIPSPGAMRKAYGQHAETTVNTLDRRDETS